MGAVGRGARWALRGGALAGMALVAACALPPDTEERIAFEPLVLDYRRQVERDFTEAPFARGAMAVVAAEGPEVRTWRLVPCRGGATVCAGSGTGPAGRLTVTPDFYVVDGLYGRRFWLSYAGDGYVQAGRILAPLAWNSLVDGTGDGMAAALESAASHR